jgi:16S rRNA (uracil1498-N3)-methyltransferase
MVFVADPLAPVVDPDDARHLLDVLRLKPGEPVVASDGVGTWVICRVSSKAGRTGRHADPASIIEVDGEVAFEPQPRLDVTVAFAPVKGDRPEWVVQKLTELGIDTIVPLQTMRSVVRWDADRAERVMERFRRVAVEAGAQCRRPRLPDIRPLSSLDQFAEIARTVGVMPAFAHPGGVRPTLEHRVIAIGPEGGWDPSELHDAGNLVGIAPTVLRAETAAVVAGALLTSFRAALIAPLA